MSGSRIARARSRSGLLAAVTVVAAAGGVSIAGAAADQTVHAVDGTEANGFQNVWSPTTVTIEPGDTVTWSFADTEVAHNVASSSDNWSFRSPYGVDQPPESFTFDTEGTYEFVCEVHATTMRGTVIVGDGGGDPGETPTPTPTPTGTPEPTPTTQPGGGDPDDDHTETPAPDGVEDGVAPTLSRVKAKDLRRAVRVRFRLSEPATVDIKVKRQGRRRAIARKRLAAPAGTSTFKVRSRRVKPRRRYVVQLRARDAAGNRSPLAKDALRGRR